MEEKQRKEEQGEENIIRLEDGTIVDMEGTNEVPEIFTPEQSTYLIGLTGHSIFHDLKRDLMNVIECCGLQPKQEQAAKRMITSALHDWHQKFKDDINLVVSTDEFFNSLSDTWENLNEEQKDKIADIISGMR